LPLRLLLPFSDYGSTAPVCGLSDMRSIELIGKVQDELPGYGYRRVTRELHVRDKKNMGDRDLLLRVFVPIVKNSRQNSLARSEMLQIARGILYRTMRVIFRIAFYSGMRLSEITRIKENVEALRLPVFAFSDSQNGDLGLVPMHPRCWG
jgi:hypothetical protein